MCHTQSITDSIYDFVKFAPSSFFLSTTSSDISTHPHLFPFNDCVIWVTPNSFNSLKYINSWQDIFTVRAIWGRILPRKG